MVVRERMTSYRAPSASAGCVHRSLALPARISPDVRDGVPPAARGVVFHCPKVMVCRPTAGFTLVELLVVMAIMAVLIAAVMVASTTLIDRAKTSNTRAVLTIVLQAVEEFEREQRANPTIAQNSAYVDRYGYFPPDELEVFSSADDFPGGPMNRSLAPGGAEIVPDPGSAYPPMKFYTQGLTPDEAAKEHRDLAAMIVAIETLGDASSVILDGLSERNRVSGPVDATSGDPLVFLDRNANGNWDPLEDLEVRYIVDDWGVSLSYFAQRDWVKGLGAATRSNNHGAWNEASTVFIRNNDGQPVIMSYGPNGKDQLTAEAMGANGTASLVWDFEGEKDDKVTNLLNFDNIYSNPSLKEKLAEGLEENP